MAGGPSPGPSWAVLSDPVSISSAMHSSDDDGDDELEVECELTDTALPKRKAPWSPSNLHRANKTPRLGLGQPSRVDATALDNSIAAGSDDNRNNTACPSSTRPGASPTRTVKHASGKSLFLSGSSSSDELTGTLIQTVRQRRDAQTRGKDAQRGTNAAATGFARKQANNRPRVSTGSLLQYAQRKPDDSTGESRARTRVRLKRRPLFTNSSSLLGASSRPLDKVRRRSAPEVIELDDSEPGTRARAPGSVNGSKTAAKGPEDPIIISSSSEDIPLHSSTKKNPAKRGNVQKSPVNPQTRPVQKHNFSTEVITISDSEGGTPAPIPGAVSLRFSSQTPKRPSLPIHHPLSPPAEVPGPSTVTSQDPDNGSIQGDDAALEYPDPTYDDDMGEDRPVPPLSLPEPSAGCDMSQRPQTGPMSPQSAVTVIDRAFGNIGLDSSHADECVVGANTDMDMVDDTGQQASGLPEEVKHNGARKASPSADVAMAGAGHNKNSAGSPRDGIAPGIIPQNNVKFNDTSTMVENLPLNDSSPSSFSPVQREYQHQVVHGDMVVDSKSAEPIRSTSTPTPSSQNISQKVISLPTPSSRRQTPIASDRSTQPPPRSASGSSDQLATSSKQPILPMTGPQTPSPSCGQPAKPLSSIRTFAIPDVSSYPVRFKRPENFQGSLFSRVLGKDSSVSTSRISPVKVNETAFGTGSSSVLVTEPLSASTIEAPSLLHTAASPDTESALSPREIFDVKEYQKMSESTVKAQEKPPSSLAVSTATITLDAPSVSDPTPASVPPIPGRSTKPPPAEPTSITPHPPIPPPRAPPPFSGLSLVDTLNQIRRDHLQSKLAPTIMTERNGEKAVAGPTDGTQAHRATSTATPLHAPAQSTAQTRRHARAESGTMRPSRSSFLFESSSNSTNTTDSPPPPHSGRSVCHSNAENTSARCTVSPATQRSKPVSFEEFITQSPAMQRTSSSRVPLGEPSRSQRAPRSSGTTFESFIVKAPRDKQHTPALLDVPRASPAKRQMARKRGTHKPPRRWFPDGELTIDDQVMGNDTGDKIYQSSTTLARSDLIQEVATRGQSSSSDGSLHEQAADVAMNVDETVRPSTGSVDTDQLLHLADVHLGASARHPTKSTVMNTTTQVPSMDIEMADAVDIQTVPVATANDTRRKLRAAIVNGDSSVGNHLSTRSSQTTSGRPLRSLRRRASRRYSHSSHHSSPDPILPKETTRAKVVSVSQDQSLPPGVSGYIGGHPFVTWQSFSLSQRVLPPKYKLAKDLPHSLQDRMNALPKSYRNSDFARIVFEEVIQEAMDDEPYAPPIKIFDNDIGEETTPPWEFVYTNEMWLGEGVPPPEVSNLTSCGCTGKCDPKSKTCACAKRQLQWLRPYIKDGVFPATWPGSPFVYDSKGILQREGCPIFECNQFCGCDEDCPNRVVQNGRRWPVNIVRTEKKGWGVFAGAKKIPRGTYIGIYAGELLTEQEGEERGHFYNAFGRTYLFSIDFHHLRLGLENEDDYENMYVVDAYHAGNFTRFLNHSCDPNCEIVACYINDADINKPLLALFTIRDVDPWEELCFSYYGDMESKRESLAEQQANGQSLSREDAVYVQCACGSRNCIGKLF